MKDRFPKWWLFYFAARKLYFIAGIPFLLLCAIVGFTLLLFTTSSGWDLYLWAYGGLAAATLPVLWRYYAAKKRQVTVNAVIDAVKATGYFSPEKGYEATSFWQSMYFGIDTIRGTMLYICIYPGGVMDVIGFDIENFTRTVVDGNKLHIYSKYVTLPRIQLDIFSGSASNIANCMHAMAEKGYNYTINFPDIIQSKRKEWENIASLPVPAVH